MLLHALGCHKGWWDWVGPALGHHYHVLAPDLRGHGESGWADDYRFASYAADLEQWVGREPYALVGHSMGGYVGLVIASWGVARPAALAAAARVPTVTMPGLYHHLPLENPEAVASLILEFLRKQGFQA